jgi:uncharacterized lipoprotein YbaY/membrane-bound inhibitor of C-type lysozyme
MGKLELARILLGAAAYLPLPFAGGALPAQQTDQAPPTAAQPHYRMAVVRREYLCAGGLNVAVTLEHNGVRLTFSNQIRTLKQIESGSDSKYSDGLLVWSVSGDFGSLEDVSVKDKPKDLAEGCILQSSYPPRAAAAGSVTGTIKYPADIELTPEANVIVELKDYTDKPHPTIATYKARIGLAGGPIPFKVSADPSKINPAHQYALDARIVVGDEVKAVNQVASFVLTQGQPAKEDLVLRATGLPKVWKN